MGSLAVAAEAPVKRRFSGELGAIVCALAALPAWFLLGPAAAASLIGLAALVALV